MFDKIFKVLEKFFTPIVKFFSKKLTFIIAPIFAILDFILGFFTGGVKALFVVWKYTAALFLVQLLRKFIIFPIVVFAIYKVLSFLWDGFTYSFLDNLTINGYIVDFINSNNFLSMGCVIGYEFGLWQALTVFFNFVIVTFVMRLFIKMFLRD